MVCRGEDVVSVHSALWPLLETEVAESRIEKDSLNAKLILRGTQVHLDISLCTKAVDLQRLVRQFKSAIAFKIPVVRHHL